MLTRLLAAALGGAFVRPVGDFKGVRAYHDTTVTWNDQDFKPLPLNSTEFDTTGAMHRTSSANLTGTVSKTNGSTTVTGSSTLFTSELSVGQVITIPGGGATDRLVVASIASNTSLTVMTAPTHTASGQTAARDNTCIVFGAGDAGYYLFLASAYIAWDVAQDAPLYIVKNGPVTTSGATLAPYIVRGAQFTPYTAQPANVGGVGQVLGVAHVDAGDYVQAWLYTDNNLGGGSGSVGGSSTQLGLQMTLTAVFLGS